VPADGRNRSHWPPHQPVAAASGTGRRSSDWPPSPFVAADRRPRVRPPPPAQTAAAADDSHSEVRPPPPQSASSPALVAASAVGRIINFWPPPQPTVADLTDGRRPICKTCPPTWRSKRTLEGSSVTGKAPPKTMDTMEEGSQEVDGRDDGGSGRERRRRKRLPLVLRLAPSTTSKERQSIRLNTLFGESKVPQIMHVLVSTPYAYGTRRVKKVGDGRVSPKRGSREAKNKGGRACAANPRHQMARRLRWRSAKRQGQKREAFDTDTDGLRASPAVRTNTVIW